MRTLFLLSFALEGIDSPCEHVLIAEGETMDAAFLWARHQKLVPEGQWDVTGCELTEQQVLSSEIESGQHLSEAAAIDLFGPRHLWDWRADTEGRAQKFREQLKIDSATGPRRYGEQPAAG